MSDSNGGTPPVPDDGPSLAELLDLESWNGNVPWEPGISLELRASGGAHLRDDRRVSIAGESYDAYVTGDRKVRVANHRDLKVGRNLALDVGGGKDTLKILGDAHIKSKERMMIGKGVVRRNWTGGMTRLIGMEGVICGGAFMKSYVGSSITLTPIATGDVYGGALHGSALRLHMTGKMGYRSAERAAWSGGMFLRSTGMTIEPVVGSPLQDVPRSMAAKAARIGLGLCPLLDITIGILMMPISIAMSIYAVAKNRKKPPPPPAGPPRVHNRTYGVCSQSRASDKSL